MAWDYTSPDGILIQNIPDNIKKTDPQFQQVLFTQRQALKQADAQAANEQKNIKDLQAQKLQKSQNRLAGRPDSYVAPVQQAEVATQLPSQLPAQAQQPIAQSQDMPQPQDTQAQPIEMGFFDSVKEAMTGNLRKTVATQQAGHFIAMPELTAVSSPLKTAKMQGVLAVTHDPSEIAQIIAENNPNVTVRQDEKGNYLFKSAINGKEYAIKPGFDAYDAIKGLASIGATVGLTALTGGAGAPAAATTTASTANKLWQGLRATRTAQAGLKAANLAAGGATNIRGAVAGAGLAQTGAELAQKSMGGEFNPEDVALAGAVGGVAQAGINTVKGGINAVRAAKSIDENVAGTGPVASLQNGQNALERARFVRDAHTQSTLLEIAYNMKLAGQGDAKAKKFVTEQLQSNLDIEKAFERRGLSQYADIALTTDNEQLRAAIQAVRSPEGTMSGNKLANDLKFIRNKANDDIAKAGGYTDMSQLADDVHAAVLAKKAEVDTLHKQAWQNAKAGELGRSVIFGNELGHTKAVLTPKFKQDIEGMASVSGNSFKELYDWANLKRTRPAGKGVMDLLTPDPATLKAGEANLVRRKDLDRLEELRYSIQNSIDDPSTTPKVASQLKELHSAIQKDIEQVYIKAGRQAEFEKAKSLATDVATFKQNMEQFFGNGYFAEMEKAKNVNARTNKMVEYNARIDDVTKRIGNLAKYIESNNMQGFNDVIKNVPESIKKPVLATSLYNLFGEDFAKILDKKAIETIDQRSSTFDMQKFRQGYDAIVGNKQANETYSKYLGKDAMEMLADYRKMADNIVKAQDLASHKSQIYTLKNEAQGANRPVQRITKNMLGFMSRFGPASITSAMGIPRASGMPVEAALKGFLTSKQSEMAALDNLVSSSSFQNMVRNSRIGQTQAERLDMKNYTESLAAFKRGEAFKAFKATWDKDRKSSMVDTAIDDDVLIRTLVNAYNASKLANTRAGIAIGNAADTAINSKIGLKAMKAADAISSQNLDEKALKQIVQAYSKRNDYVQDNANYTKQSD